MLRVGYCLKYFIMLIYRFQLYKRIKTKYLLYKRIGRIFSVEMKRMRRTEEL